MKGKDLVEFIQRYGLEEYDFPVCGDDGMFRGYISLRKASQLYHVPISDIRALIRDGELTMVRILNEELIPESEANDILSELGAKSKFQRRKERIKNEFTRASAN